MTPGLEPTKTRPVRPVAMEGQRFEIPEDPSQSVPEGSPMDPIWYYYFLKLSRIPGKTISHGDRDQHRPEKFPSRPWIRRGAISCFPHTSFDEINDSVVNSNVAGSLGAPTPLGVQRSLYGR